MVDKIKKSVAILSAKEKNAVMEIINKLQSGDLEGLDIKRLKGTNDVFRARKGRIRIIYSSNNRENRIISISRRSEKTFRDF